ncbi:major facilitator superfamily transporter [Xylaria flabelliformis]|nr:major facilitator superfamily transporter [Xylaria flabelliformis]
MSDTTVSATASAATSATASASTTSATPTGDASQTESAAPSVSDYQSSSDVNQKRHEPETNTPAAPDPATADAPADAPADVPTDTPANGDDEAQNPPEEDWKPSMHEKAVIYTIAITSLIVALDATIVITPLSTITQSLNATATQAFWIGTSYLLVNAVTMPVICAVSEVFGRPICLTFALVAFALGTILCATAQDIGTLLAGRSVQGIGGGGIHSLGLVIQTDIVPLRWRPRWYGVTLGFWALGLAIGPIIGGAVVHGTTWRWIFYLMFPFLGFSLIAVPYLLTLKPKEATLSEKLVRIDWLGSLIFTGSATSFLIAVSWGGSQFEWASIQTLVPLILGFVGLLFTLVYERFWAKQAFLRHSLYHNASSIVGYICGSIQGMVLYGLLYYGPFYFLSVKGYSPLDTGIGMLPATLTVTIAGIICGRLVTRYNHYRWPIQVGWFIASIGAGLFLIWPHNDSAAVWTITYLVIGVGQGAILNAQNFATQAMCKQGDEAAAASMYAFVRQFGMALGVGIGGTTFQNVMAIKLRSLGLPVEIAKQAESYISVLHGLRPGPYKNNVMEAYKFGFTGVFSFYFGISVVAFVISLTFIRNVDLTRHLESEHRLDGSRWEKQHNKLVATIVSSKQRIGI